MAERDNAEFAFLPPIISIVLFVGFIANTLALIVIRKSYQTTGHPRRLSVPSFLVQALVVVDLFSVVVLLLENAILNVIWPGTVLKCNLDYVTRLSVAYGSGFINALMCLERCIAFRAPFYYHDKVTVFKAKVAVFMVICFSMLLSVLPVIGVGSYAEIRMTSENVTLVICTPPAEIGFRSDLGNQIFAGIYISVNAVMLVIIYICNTLVVWTLRQLGRKTVALELFTRYDYAGSSTPNNSADDCEKQVTVVTSEVGNRKLSVDSSVDTEHKDFLPKLNPEKSRVRIRSEVRLAVMVCVISVVFTISWLPFYIQRLLKAFDVEQPNWYLLLVIFLLVSNHVIDPFVFVFMKQQSRDALRDLCMKCVCCRRCRPPPAAPDPMNISANGRHNRGAPRQNSGIAVVTLPAVNITHNPATS